MTKIKWYKIWHETRWSHGFHVFILVIMCLSILSNLLPTSTMAALNTKTITKTSLSDFAEGSLNDLLNENDSLSMHLGKKVNTGNSSTSADLNSYSGRAITRTADGKIHIAWLKKESAPKQIYYTASIDEGSNWEIPTVVATDTNATGVLAKVDGNAQVHLFWAVANAGGNQIKHRIKGSDGSWGAIFTVPTNELDGAVADWQAIPQGDHYGNYYDTVSGGLATVTRSTPKTIYDATTGKIHDVPAGYLGVRPRSDGKLGYEAEIEESKTNYLKQSSFETDSNTDGLTDVWTRSTYQCNGVSTTSLVTDNVYQTKAQNWSYTASDTDSGYTEISQPTTDANTFAPGDLVTFSSYIKGTTVGVSVKLYLYVYDGNGPNGTYITSYSTTILPTTSWARYNAAWTMPANTNRVRAIFNVDNVNMGDSFNLTFDGAQLEKSASPSSYIPTVATTTTRNGDVVTVPTTNWKATEGTWQVLAEINANELNRGGQTLVNCGNGANQLQLYRGGNSVMTSEAKGADNLSVYTSTPLLAGLSTYGLRWTASAISVAANGTVVSSASDNTTTLASTASISGSAKYTHPIARFVAYGVALSDQQMADNAILINTGTEEALLRNPAADWQAVSQGDHYGNFQNSVGGGLATVTRNTTKTIYDPTTSKIYDVPANYLGVRPRSDGKTGLEAEIEESRTSFLRNNSMENDANSDGLGDEISTYKYGLGSEVYTMTADSIHGAKAQRIQYAGAASDSGLLRPSNWYTFPTTQETKSFTFSAFIKGNQAGIVSDLQIFSFDYNWNSLGIVSQPITISPGYTRYSATYNNLPPGTRIIYCALTLSSINPGDVLDVTTDAWQLEEGTFATSFIPTTNATVTRANDNVTVPTTGWSPSNFTVSAYVGQHPAVVDVYRRVLRWVNPTGDTGVYVSSNPAVFQFAVNTMLKGVWGVDTYGATKTDPMMSFIATQVSGGAKKSYTNGVLSSAGTSQAISDLNSTANLGSHAGTSGFYNGAISRLTFYSSALSATSVTKVSQSQTNGSANFDNLVPSVDTSSNIHLTYNKGGGVGIGYRMWNGSSWTTPNLAAVVASVGDHSHQNTLSIGSNLYYFYTLDSDGKRYMVRRTGGTWSAPVLVSDFISHDSNEIVDSDGNIQIFTIDESLSDTILKNRKYIVSGNSFTGWSVLDSQSAKDVGNPSATITSNGNVWVYYNIGSDIYYKIVSKANGIWGNRTSYSTESLSSWSDLSGSNNNGTLYNFDSTPTSGWTGSGTANDPYGLAITATNDYVPFAETNWQAWSGGVSIGLWVNASTIYSGENGGFNREGGYRLGIVASGTAGKWRAYSMLGTTDKAWGSVNISGNSLLDLNTWYYITVRYDPIAQNVKLYVNGVEDKVLNNVTGNILKGYNAALTRFGSGSFSGKISDVKVYNRPLSDTEISQSFLSGNSASTGYATNGLVLDLNASKVDGISSPSGGPTVYPKVRYQENFHYFPDKVDLLYRQNPTGNTSTYNLYYGTVGSDSTGTYVSPESGDKVLSSNWLGGWGNPALSSNVNIPSGTAINYELRSGSGSDKNNVTWGSWVQTGRVDSTTGTGNRLYTIAAANMPNLATLPMGTNKYLQVRINLISENGTNVPALYDYSLNYLADEAAPQWTYPAAVPAFTDATKATALTSGIFTGKNTGTSAYFDWAGATEPVGESGISNYYVYFGPDITANPLTAGTDKGTTTEGLLDIATPVSGTNYYLRVSVKDVAGNLLSMPSGASIFTYKFDNERPKPPTNYSVSPVGWSNVNSFDFTWQAAIDPGSGSSNIKEYQYKRAGGGDGWTMVAAAASITIPDVTSYKDGMNDFFIRSVDTAGNHSGDTVADWTVIHYYYNGTAPSKPQNVTVDPQQSNTNSFTFSWSEPANHNAPIKGYYYSINEAPTLTNSVFTTATTTGAIPAAVKQGPNNKFYVVAVDTANDSLLGELSDELVFECNTVAPGIPGGVVISDSSNLQDNNWILTVAWNKPTGLVSGYKVYRSTDGVNFINVGTTDKDNLVFSNSGLSHTSTYSYKVMAVDSAGAESAYSSTVILQPTGKFVQPPIIVSGPDVKATASSAVVTWTTDRASSSFVAASKNTDYQGASGQLDTVTSHKVILTGLEPGATYNYKVQSFDENRNYTTDEAYSTPYSFATQSAPGIAEVEISDIRLNTAIITWKTTTVATSTLLYGKSNTYGQTLEDKSGSSVTTHTVKLEGLDHTSTYHFRIKGTDTDGNQLVSDDYNFDTLTYPKVSEVKFEQQKNASTSTIRVVWSSNVPTTSIVEYAEGNGGYKEVSKSTLETKHSMLVSSLRDNTPYRMVVKGRDAYGTEAVSDVNTVKTDFDTRPPAIFNVMTESSIVGFGTEAKTQVIISWESDEPSSSQVEYDVGTFGDGYTLKTQEDGGLTTSHVVIISGLKPSTSYHFRAVSKDSSSNNGYSEDGTILTDQASSSIIDIIVNSLQNSLGWLFGSLSRG